MDPAQTATGNQTETIGWSGKYTGRPVVILDDNDLFIRYFRAVGLSAGVRIVGLSDVSRLAIVLDYHQPSTVITDLHMPDLDAIELLPVLKKAWSVKHLVILSGAEKPLLDAAARLARAQRSWTVETWTKPIRTAFLRERLQDFACQGALAAPHTGEFRSPSRHGDR